MHVEDEFIAVRVQDPRIQNEGSWNSYVDYKIFLHTNSKAFTAKTSCVRRRYSEFVWLKKKLQKNAGLVPVPDLPGKSLFSFSNDDFLEKRRKGLQTFLDRVVHMTVCLSDSQLHLFLQTQLPVGHIQDCVQGHTPYTVTDAILTYASSNRGFAQAQEDDPIKEPSLTVSYESMESPAPHQPCLQTKEPSNPELFSSGDFDPLESLLEDTTKSQLSHSENDSIRVLQKSDHLEAIMENCGPMEARFFLGDNEDEQTPESLTEQPLSCLVHTSVELHSPMGNGFEDNVQTETAETEKEVVSIAQNVSQSDSQEAEGQCDSPTEEIIEKVTCDNSEVVLVDENDGVVEQVRERCQEDVNTEKLAVNGLEHDITAGHMTGVISPEQMPEENLDEGNTNETLLPVTYEDIQNVAEGEVHDNDSIQQTDALLDQTKQVDLDKIRNNEDSDEDNQSMQSSNESIVKVSDEESICDDAEEDMIKAANGYIKTSSDEVSHWSEAEASSIFQLQMNGCPLEKEDISDEHSAHEEADTVMGTSNISDLTKTVDVGSTESEAAGDLTENSDFSILETSRVPELADGKYTEQETLSSLSLDASEESHEVEVH
ncbi:sorting nexin-11 [Sphaeramia orbicularis]|uniref:PX domain-containing protein n=1 Tax=Sphaeramia orbicularis TaxID=375764 RepID=A0A672Y778_9TELE|nr:sorting nexin-11 [Sphaeramia orbicularis]